MAESGALRRDLTMRETVDWHAETPSGAAVRDHIRELCKKKLEAETSGVIEIRDFAGRLLERIERPD